MSRTASNPRAADTGRLAAVRRLRLRWLQGPRPGASPARQRALFAIAAGIFAVATVLAVRGLPPVPGGVRWLPLLLIAALGVPSTALANALEYAVSARVLGRQVRLGESLRVSVMATAANLLPLPGSVLVRTEALRRLGGGYGRAAAATGLLAVVWVGTLGTVGGGLLLVRGDPGVGAAFLAAGAGALGLAWLLLHRAVPRPRRLPLAAAMLAVELLSVLAGGARLFLALRAVGHAVGLEDAIALTVGGVVASATGIFPGGLGIRELVAAAVSPLVGIPAAVGLVAVALNRAVEYAVLLPLTLSLAATRRRRGEPAGAAT